jgi:hypothetical protein
VQHVGRFWVSWALVWAQPAAPALWVSDARDCKRAASRRAVSRCAVPCCVSGDSEALCGEVLDFMASHPSVAKFAAPDDCVVVQVRQPAELSAALSAGRKPELVKEGY